jgi:hypothetical protein
VVRATVVIALGAGAFSVLAACNAIIGSRSLTYAPDQEGGAPLADGAGPGPSSDGSSDQATPDSALPPASDGGIDSGADAEPGGGDAACTIPSGAMCAVDPQCGCPANKKCDLPNGNAACTSFGTSAVGELCPGGSVACERGATCTDGVCHPFCAIVGVPCPAGPINSPPLGQCTENGGNTAQGFLCPLTCTLYPNSCGNGAMCVAIPQADGGLFSDCEAPGVGQSGDPCSTDTDCDVDFGCDNGACQQWCNLGATKSGCPVGTTCATPASATIDGVSYGFCQ